MDRMIVAAVKAARSLARRIKRHPRVRSALYRDWNREYFSEADVHEMLVADRRRIDAYRAAIEKHVGPDDVVVDLGTGIGILAFLASRQQPRAIHAIDHSEAIIDLARFFAERNRIGDIDFTAINSRRFQMDGKASVLLHENMELFIFNEMLDDVCELRDRILAPGGTILPGKFHLFLEPICLRDDCRLPYLWEQEIEGISFAGYKEWRAAHGGLESVRRFWPIRPGQAEFFLSEPQKVLTVDLATYQPGSIPAQLDFRKTVVHPGRIDGFCLYFEIVFDDQISFFTGPFDTPSTSWAPYVFRTEARELDRSDVLSVQWKLPDVTDVHTWEVSYTLSQPEDRAVRRRRATLRPGAAPPISPDTIVVASSDLLSAPLADEEVVLLDNESGRYYGLNPVGARVWELVAAPVRVAAIVETIIDEYDVDVDRCRAEVLALLRDMSEAGLIEIRRAPHLELERE